MLARAALLLRARPAPAAARVGPASSTSRPTRVEELCLAADCLVTDYSSLMFDYAVLDRPIVIHAPDWEVYRTLRGTYFDLLAEPPGAVTRTQDELVAVRSAGAGGRRRDAAARRSGRVSARSKTAGRPNASYAGCCPGRGSAAEPPVRGRLAPPLSADGGRRLVLVVGVGRSGTSLFTGILGQLSNT